MRDEDKPRHVLLPEREPCREQVARQKKAGDRTGDTGTCLYESLFNLSPDLMALVDERGTFLKTNPAMRRSLGISEGELEGKTFHDVLGREVALERLGYGLRALRENRTIVVETERFDTNAGCKRFFTDRYVPFDASAAPRTFVVFSREITREKKAEEEFRQQKRRYRELFERSRDGFVVVDTNGCFLDANQSYCDMLGYSRSELRRLNHFFEVTPERWHKWEQEEIWRNRLLAHGYSGIYEKEYIHKNGTVFPVEIQSYAVMKDNGSIEYLWGAARDIRERKQERHALELSEERYRSVVQNAMDAIFMADSRGKILSWNNGAECIYGYRPEEIIGKDFFLLLPDEAREQQKNLLEKAVASGTIPGEGRAMEGLAVDKTGKKFPIEVAFNVFTLHDEVFLTVIVRDITGRKRAEEQLVHLGAAVEQATDAIQIEGADGCVRYVNAAHERIFSRSRTQLVGRSRSDFTNNEKRERIYRELKNTVSQGEVWSGRVGFTNPDGRNVELDVRATPITDGAGKQTGFVTVYRDITDMVRMEEQLRESQKIEAIGTLAGGVAHEFNNILSGIMGYAEVAKDAAAEGEPPEEFLDVIIRYCDRAAELTGQILTFSHKAIKEFKPVKLQPVVKEAMKLLRATIPATIDIKQHVDERCAPVIANQTQLHQVLLNLCTNAAHAMEQSIGVLSVTLDSFLLSGKDTAQYPELRPGKHVRLTVSDTGCGIDPAIRDKVCEPFFTTREAGRGTGMGLAVVQGIVKTHNGALRIESTPGSGTTCSVVLPVIETAVQGQEDQPEPLPTGVEHILFVDDELHLVEMAPEFFSSLGYTVTAVQTAAEALELFRKRPHIYDLIITDYTMPKMTGLMLAREIKNIRQDIPLILCSGYNDVTPEMTGSSHIFRSFIMKPFKRSIFARTIRDVLDTKDY